MDLPDGEAMDLDPILAGEESFLGSHAGGELAEVLEIDMRKERYVLAFNIPHISLIHTKEYEEGLS